MPPVSVTEVPAFRRLRADRSMVSACVRSSRSIRGSVLATLTKALFSQEATSPSLYPAMPPVMASPAAAPLA